MSIESLIATGIQPVQIPSPLAQASQLAQLRTFMNQNELARSTQARLQREDVDRNALNAAYRAAYDPQTGNIDPAKLRAAMVTGGQGAQLPAIERDLAELEAKRLAQSKTKIEAAQAGETLIAGALRNLGADPSDSSIDAALADLGGSNLFTPDRMRSLTAFGNNLKRLPDNERRARLAQQGVPPAAPTSPEVRRKAEEDRIAQAARNLAPNPTDANIDSTVAMLMSTNAVSPDRRPGLLAFVDRLKAMPLAQRTAVLAGQGASARPSQLLTPGEEAQKARIAAAGRTPPQQGPLEQIVDKSGNVILVPRDQAIGETPARAMIALTPQDKQKREAKYPQATMAVNTFEKTADKLAADLETLAKHPGLPSITGLVAGRVPGITKEGRAAEALFKTIMARGGFQELTNMRQASPTGSALGNQSNQEGQYLRDAFAPLSLTQNASDLIKNLNNAASAARESKGRVREAYDLTYEYRSSKGGGGVDTNNPLLQ